MQTVQTDRNVDFPVGATPSPQLGERFLQQGRWWWWCGLFAVFVCKTTFPNPRHGGEALRPPPNPLPPGKHSTAFWLKVSWALVAYNAAAWVWCLLFWGKATFQTPSWALVAYNAAATWSAKGSQSCQLTTNALPCAPHGLCLGAALLGERAHRYS